MSASADGRSVHVAGVAAASSAASLSDYFAFVGEVDAVELHDAAQPRAATVTFKRPSAASSAVMLSGGVVDGAALTITLPGAAAASERAAAAPEPAAAAGAPVAQEDKPAAARVAELLAAGYALSDDVAARALALDQQHGLSAKFKAYLASLDHSLGAQITRHAPPPPPPQPAAMTQQTEHTPQGAAATLSASEKEASAAPVPGDSPAEVGPRTTTTVPGAAAAPQTASEHAQQAVEGLSKTVQAKAGEILTPMQAKAGEILNRPDVKSRTDFAWAKLSEYYSAVANHPRIHSLYTSANKTVKDVHEEARKIAAEKKAGGAGGAAGTSAPAARAGHVSQASMPLLLVAVLLFSSLSMGSVAAHGEEEPASVAGEAPHAKGKESYIQRHMASEHHIGAFDLGAFHSLHDLNRDGVLDRAEIEAIYGVHHSTSVKHSPTYEVHDAKADRIVKEVLKRIDANGDALITKAEFVNAGADGLPLFEEYGKGILGHHYDEESEYFVHHEEVFHNTPETQTDESYNHKEDIEHFAHHGKIEAEEERRERKAEGMPTREQDERRKADALLRGETYTSPYDAQIPQKDSPTAPQMAYDSHAQDGGAAYEARVETQHTFRTPEGEHVVRTKPDEAFKAQAAAQEHNRIPEREEGETAEGYKARLSAHAQRLAAAENWALANPGLAARPSGDNGRDPTTGALKQMKGESDEAFLDRKNKEKFQASKQRPKFQGVTNDMRKAAPYKGRMKSYFGEF